MARLDADGMIELVRDYCGGETSETLSNTRILRFLNQSYLYYCNKHQFPQMLETTTITTSSGTASYELSVADVAEINYLVNTTSNLTLRRIDSKQYNEYTQGDTSTITGVPVYYVEDGVGSTNSYRQITFYPTPNGTYSITMSYWENPVELTASPSATSPVIPDAWDNIIVLRAASKAWMMLGDQERSVLMASAAQAEEDQIIGKIQNRTTQPRTQQSRIGKALRGI